MKGKARDSPNPPSAPPGAAVGVADAVEGLTDDGESTLVLSEYTTSWGDLIRPI